MAAKRVGLRVAYCERPVQQGRGKGAEALQAPPGWYDCATPNDYFVEDGSYVRLRNLQIGYTIPQSMTRYLPRNSRVYIQGENLFTITGYDGLDPVLPAANVNGAAGDIRDQYMGVDRGSYPASRTFSIGFSTSF